jgi:hypothetical protein
MWGMLKLEVEQCFTQSWLKGMVSAVQQPQQGLLNLAWTKINFKVDYKRAQYKC